MKISIIILNWNGEEMLRTFLPSVVGNTPRDIADIIIADNGSTDSSLAYLKANYPGISIITFDRNHGFAGGYNRAMQKITTPYAILLNNDVEVTPGWLDAPIELLEQNPGIACIQPKILSWKNPRYFEYAGAAGGYIDRYGYPFCRGRIFNETEQDRGQYEDEADILWASGAALFIRTDVYRSEGGLDEYFFAHQEEVDLCWRLRNRGYRILYTPRSVVYHKGGATLDTGNPRKTYLNFRNNLLMIQKNAHPADRRRILAIRRTLDHIAALRFLLGGNIKDAMAVIRARRHFRIAKKSLIREGKGKAMPECPKQVPGLIHKSIIWQYYVLRRRTFSDIIRG